MATLICRRLLAGRLAVHTKCVSMISVDRPFFAVHPKLVSPFVVDKGPSTKSLCAFDFKLATYSTSGPDDCDAEPKKLSLYQRFKQMYKNYWYVLVPVHMVTSVCWFGGFYYMAKSGIDIVPLMESWHFSDWIVNPLKDSSMGYVAVAYALYKIATPLRYTVTLGGTTVTITYLRRWGYLKPVPSREQLKELYKEKKDSLIYTMQDKTSELKLKKEQLKHQTDELMTKINRKEVLRDINKPVKK